MDKKIAFLGLGIMGRAMAANLLKAGFDLTIYNRTEKKTDDFIKTNGGKKALSPAEAARDTDIIITMVSDSADVESVSLGSNGIFQGAKPKSIVIDMSTISPTITQSISKRLLKNNIEMLDAPVSGGENGAINASLTIMVGGKKEIFEQCVPVFDVLGKTITHMGPSGSGQLTKLCNQIIGSNTLFAVCEGLLFASKAGLNMEKMLQALSGGSAQSFMLTKMAPKIMDRDFRPGFFVMHEQKDLRLALETAQELGISLPGTGLIQQLYNSLGNTDEGAKLGHFSLVKALEKLADHEVHK